MKEPILVVACGGSFGIAEEFFPVPVVYHEKGLSVARGIQFRGTPEPHPTRYWRVYHQESGLTLGWLYGDTIAEAISMVKAMTRLRGIKWTWPTKRLSKYPKAMAKARLVAQSFGKIR